MAQPEPGWYPVDGGQVRYWSGTEWTEHTAPDPNAQQATAEPAPQLAANARAAGWYPAEPGQLRYWSGTEWTQHTAPDPNSAGPQPLPTQGAAPVPTRQVIRTAGNGGGCLSTFMNVWWLIFAGLGLAISYTVFGIIACILIITIPAGVASFRIAGYVIWPFGRQVVPKRDAGTGSVIMNVIWFIFAGLWLCISHVASAIVLCVTIIGIPLAVADIKMIPVCAFPFGKEIVPSGSQEIEIVTY